MVDVTKKGTDLMTPEQIAKAQKTVELVGLEEQEGFIITTRKSIDDDGDVCMNTTVKLNSVNRMFVMETVMKALDMDSQTFLKAAQILAEAHERWEKEKNDKPKQK